MADKIRLREPWFDWANYDDVGSVLELGATYDDALKKNGRFLTYSVTLANRICQDLNLKARVTWGKWGGRLDPEFNQMLTHQELEDAAKQITGHRSWKALMESTYVFTYGKSEEEWPTERERKGAKTRRS